MTAVDGKVTGMPEADVTTGRILHELDGALVLSSKGSTDSAASGFIETNVLRISRVSLVSLDAIGAAPPEWERADKAGGCWLIRAHGVRW